jgi:hypothetical protein
MGPDPAQAPGFISSVINNLTTNTNLGGESFDSLEQSEDQSALEFHPQDSDGNFAFNFAVARVRLLGKTAGAQAIATRVFFRLFNAQTTASTYDQNTSYRFASDSVLNGHKIALMGVQNDGSGNPEYVTLPCFASPRINLNGPASMADQQDSPNVQTINVQPGVEVDTYFGCWLDINQPQQQFLPASPPPGNFDGPWSGALQSINQVITRAPHQCLVAEIKFDGTPIPPFANSGTSDKLAQRNVAWIDGPNPGEMESRRMPHPIELRPTPMGATSNDELMILWGTTPNGATASLYLPAINSADILTLANAMYASHRLTATDAHTIRCPVGGATFVPLPSGTARLAGLLTVELPGGIKKGDAYNILARQVTVDTYTPLPPIGRGSEAAPAKTVTSRNPYSPYSWRAVTGAFQFAIVISTKEQLLFKEQRLLASLRWIQLSIPTNSRWYPVFQRYVEQIAGRVHGFGGNPVLILPSATGDVPGHPLPKPPKGGGSGSKEHSEYLELTGKVIGICHDRFGDFDGFLLLTECGKERRFRGREHSVARLVTKAWEERAVISIQVEHHRHDWPVSILVRRAPEPFQH